MKSGSMAVLWCAKKCHSEALGTATELSEVFEKSTVQDLVDVHRAAKHVKETPGVGMVFPPIHLAEVVFGQVAVGSLLDKGEILSHRAYLVFVTTRGLAAGQRYPVLLLAKRSGKIERVCAGSLSAEANSMVGAAQFANGCSTCN